MSLVTGVAPANGRPSGHHRSELAECCATTPHHLGILTSALNAQLPIGRAREAPGCHWPPSPSQAALAPFFRGRCTVRWGLSAGRIPRTKTGNGLLGHSSHAICFSLVVKPPSTDLRGEMHNGPDPDRTSWGHVLFRTNPSTSTHFYGRQSLATSGTPSTPSANFSLSTHLAKASFYPTPVPRPMPPMHLATSVDNEMDSPLPVPIAASPSGSLVAQDIKRVVNDQYEKKGDKRTQRHRLCKQNPPPPSFLQPNHPSDARNQSTPSLLVKENVNHLIQECECEMGTIVEFSSATSSTAEASE